MEAHNYLRVLNGRIAAITAMILFNLGSFGVLGMSRLIRTPQSVAVLNYVVFYH